MQTDVVELPYTVDGETKIFHVTVGMLTEEQDQECQAFLRGGQKATSRTVSKLERGQRQPSDTQQITELSLDMKAYREAVLLRGIREWDLTYQGAVVAIDAAHVHKLSDRDASLIFERIKELSELPDKEQEGK
jgi:hypothetical protein